MKPRLKLFNSGWGREWACISDYSFGSGPTPKIAYRRWRTQEDARVERANQWLTKAKVF